MAFRPFDPPAECWVVKCKRCGHATPVVERKRGAPPPSETVIVTCHLCSEKCRYLPAEIYAGRPSANFISNKETVRRLRKVAVVFIPRDGYTVYCLADDLKTCISPHMLVKKSSTLRNMLRYLGATLEELAQHDLAMKSWGQGSTLITLQPGKENLLRIRKEFLP